MLLVPLWQELLGLLRLQKSGEYIRQLCAEQGRASNQSSRQPPTSFPLVLAHSQPCSYLCQLLQQQHHARQHCSFVSCLPPKTLTDILQWEGRKWTRLDPPECVTGHSWVSQQRQVADLATAAAALRGVSWMSPNGSQPNLAKVLEEIMPLLIIRDDNWSKTAIMMPTVTISWREKEKIKTTPLLLYCNFPLLEQMSLRLAGLDSSVPQEPEATQSMQSGPPSPPTERAAGILLTTNLLLQRSLTQTVLSTRTQSLHLLGRGSIKPTAARHVSRS